METDEIVIDEHGQAWVRCRAKLDARGTLIAEYMSAGDATLRKAQVHGRPPELPPTDAGRAVKVLAKWLLNPPDGLLPALPLGRLKHLPHQFRALRAYATNPAKRVLLADEVGTGKTVAAGYVIVEEILQRKSDRIIILAPAALLTKWRRELRRRFNRHFDILRAKDLAEVLAHPELPCFGIASHDLNGAQLAPFLDGDYSWDMVVIDEAHNLIGRSGETLRRQMGAALMARARGGLLLTATPIQLEADDLVRILTLLDPSLDSQFWRGALSVHRRILAVLGKEEVSLAEIESVRQAMGTDIVAWHGAALHRALDEAALAARDGDIHQARTVLFRASPLHAWYTRTRKFEAGLERHRDVRTIHCRFEHLPRMAGKDGRLTTEAEVAKAVDEFFSLCLGHVHRMQLASTSRAAIKALENGAQGHVGGAWRDEAAGLGYAVAEPRLAAPERARSRDLLAQLQSVKSEPKVRALKAILEEMRAAGSNCIVFTQWLQSVDEIRNALKGWNIPHACVTGSTPEGQREATVRRLAQEEWFVLVATDTMAEGVDLFGASAVVNFDLPYNPQLLEQRIGRIDRIGQEADTIIVRNLVMVDTVEERIHEILIERIHVFADSLGGLEQVIESAIREDRDAADVVAMVERARQLEAVTDSALAVPTWARDGSSGARLPEAALSAWATHVLELLGLDALGPSDLAAVAGELVDVREAPEAQAGLQSLQPTKKAAPSAYLAANPLSPFTRALAKVISGLPSEQVDNPSVNLEELTTSEPLEGLRFARAVDNVSGGELDAFETLAAALLGLPKPTEVERHPTASAARGAIVDAINQRIFRAKRLAAIAGKENPVARSEAAAELEKLRQMRRDVSPLIATSALCSFKFEGNP